MRARLGSGISFGVELIVRKSGYQIERCLRTKRRLKNNVIADIGENLVQEWCFFTRRITGVRCIRTLSHRWVSRRVRVAGRTLAAALQRHRDNCQCKYLRRNFHLSS